MDHRKINRLVDNVRSGKLGTPPPRMGVWVRLAGVSCHYCLGYQTVSKRLDDGPEGLYEHSVMACSNCKRTWNEDSGN